MPPCLAENGNVTGAAALPAWGGYVCGMSAPPPRPPSRVGLARRSGRTVRRRIEAAFSVHGWAFRRLAISYAATVAGDTLIALALADTLFFSVPTAEARSNVIAYLLVTLAPFAVIGPLLGAIFSRFPGSYRVGLVASSGFRIVVAVLMMRVNGEFSLLILAFFMLVLSRVFGISRSSVLPLALPQPVALVSANARLARLGILAGALVVPFGVLSSHFVDTWLTLLIAAIAFGWSMIGAISLRIQSVPRGSIDEQEPTSVRHPASPRAVRYSRIATAIVRLLNGYLLLLMAFAFREAGEGVASFGLLLGAAGLGFALASYLAAFLEQRLREEPMVVAALALEAAAAFVAAHVFGVWAAAALSLFAGLAWGTAKFGYDGLLQASVGPSERGAAFTRSETLFQLAWVVGAIIPVLVPIPTAFGLVLAGCVALTAQVTIVSALLVSVREHSTLTP